MFRQVQIEQSGVIRQRRKRREQPRVKRRIPEWAGTVTQIDAVVGGQIVLIALDGVEIVKLGELVLTGKRSGRVKGDEVVAQIPNTDSASGGTRNWLAITIVSKTAPSAGRLPESLAQRCGLQQRRNGNGESDGSYIDEPQVAASIVRVIGRIRVRAAAPGPPACGTFAR